MKKLRFMALIVIALYQVVTFAEQTLPSQPIPKIIRKPIVAPTPPMINAKAYILIDANSGKVLAEKNSEEKLPPASLTKMMTLYVISSALSRDEIHLSDKVTISENAWRAEGSRMFVKVGDQVDIEQLIKGIIVDSGNDACIAMAEHIGGGESGFADIMNQQAQGLGMTQSHFTDSTGLPNPEHYTTAKDLAILGRALINHFPQYYPWYQQKWFTYNGIKQPNRNRLLWRNGHVDGIKTGHTDEAGYCLVSSAENNNMRLVAVILGAPSDNSRADDSERLLNYGFRFFETHPLYQAGQVVKEEPIYKGSQSLVKIGTKEAIYVTVPSGQFKQLSAITHLPSALVAPVKKNAKIGELILEINKKPVATYPLYALESVESGSIITRAKDAVKLSFKKWFG